MEKYDDSGYGRFNGQLGDALNRAAAGWETQAATGELSAEAAAELYAEGRAFVAENFTFHRGDQELDRAALFGRQP